MFTNYMVKTKLKVYPYEIELISTLPYVGGSPGETWYRLWHDGNFLYISCDEDGIRVYSVTQAGVFTLKDQIIPEASGSPDSQREIWSDANFVYAAAGYGGIQTFTRDANGVMTFKDFDRLTGPPTNEFLRCIWSDGGDYVYTGGWRNTVYSYSVDVDGILTLVDSLLLGDTVLGITGDGAGKLFVGANSQGLVTVGVDGAGQLTYLDEHIVPFAGWYSGVVYDPNTGYIHADAVGGDGKMLIYSVDGGGLLTNLAEFNPENQATERIRLYKNGTVLFVPGLASGLDEYGLEILEIVPGPEYKLAGLWRYPDAPLVSTDYFYDVRFVGDYGFMIDNGDITTKTGVHYFKITERIR